MKFIIAFPCQYTEQYGGVMALGNLAKQLTDRGHEVYSVYGMPPVGSWAKVVSPDGPDGPVVIYPEVISGNPLGGRRVVRWLLNTPGVCGGDGIYNQSDLIFLWSRMYHAPAGVQVAGELALADWHEDLFLDRGGPRSGSCWMKRKGWVTNYHPEDATNIDDYFQRGGNTYLADVFNAHETFFCYDKHTQITTIAAQCGCQSIVVPDNGLSLAEWLTSQANIPGVAYGLDDIDRAKEERARLPEYLAMQRKESENQLDLFLAKVQAWLATS